MDITDSLFEFYGLGDGQFHSIGLDESPAKTTLYIDGKMAAIEERAPLPMTMPPLKILQTFTQDEWDRLWDV